MTDFARQAGTPKVGRLEASEAAGQRFSAAMERTATDRSATTSSSLDSTTATRPPEVKVAANSSTTADAQERARRALNLNPPKTAPQGDTILHGLQNLRGVFDKQEARINNLSSVRAADTNTLLSMQMEVAKFSVLVDVTSKLTGKSTQALESLLKGQ
ncbi:EscI/YscI/HrpB family type III secretion system inner rod protein [Bradyrhizobium sp. CCBAU 53351]|nr:EscI/YscI/HrpB family type III secretion system inner rod protein [Bradyrhizobium sp. CCBAU 53351]